MVERIISADSHFEIPMERVLGYMPERHREAFTAMRKASAERVAATGAAPQPAKLRNLPVGVTWQPAVVRAQDMKWPASGRAGVSDPLERLKDMDTDQVAAEVLYLNFAEVDQFYGLDNDGATAGFEAFTLAALDVASADPNRLVPVYPLVLHDIDGALSAVQRIAGQGGRAVMVPAFPTDFSLAPYWNEIYDPLWSLLEELAIPVSQHVHIRRSAGEIGMWDPTPTKAIMASIPPIFMAELLGGWVLTGIFDRHPQLKVVLVEAGIGWIPYYLQRLDKMQDRHGWDGAGLKLAKRPSEYWRSNMAATFEEDLVAMKLLDELGIDNIMWATDYPHADSTWPVSQDVIKEHFETFTAADRHKVIAGNAARLYRL
jgi:predicted TIM-barrel fold metal-dependent hydrolase